MKPCTLLPNARGLMGMPSAPGSGTALVAHSPDGAVVRLSTTTSSTRSVLEARFMSVSLSTFLTPTLKTDRRQGVRMIAGGSSVMFQRLGMNQVHLLLVLL